MENKIRLNEIKIYSEGYEKIAKSLNELNRMKIITILFSMILMSIGIYRGTLKYNDIKIKY